MDDEGWKNYCHQCGIAGPWVGLPDGPKCFCDDTWFRRACLWSRSKKGWWFCNRCFPAGADQAQAMDNLCVHHRFKATEALRIQTQKQQADIVNFHAIHQQQFQSRTDQGKFNRATGNYVGRPRPAAGGRPPDHGKELKMINGRWMLVEPEKKKEDIEDARSLRDMMGITAKPRRSRSRSRSRKKRKKKRRKSSSSSSSSTSRSSNSSGSPVEVVSGSNKTGDSKPSGETESDEAAKAKTEVLNKLLKIKEIGSKEERQKEFRSLLRAWHPDKNPENVEVATIVFQFLQKGKSLLD